MQHHEDSIVVFTERMRADPDVLGIVLDGSVAAGTERADSDVDLCLVLTEPAFERAWQHNRLSYVEHEGITYQGGYYDIKVSSPRYLGKAVEHADDPTRPAMLHAHVAWTRMEGLPDLVAAIPRLPQEVWEQRMASFIAKPGSRRCAA